MLTTRPPYLPRFAQPPCVVVGAASAANKDTPGGAGWWLPALALAGGGAVGYLVGGLGCAAILGLTAGGGILVGRWSAGAGGPALGTGGRLHGRILACSPPGVPAGPPGVAPAAGYASAMLFHWCYEVGVGDSAGSIAGAIMGDEARYQELVLANVARLETVGTPGAIGADEWNFAPGAIGPGTRLDLPQTWNDHIDERGQPRGQISPFPEDPRHPGGVGESVGAFEGAGTTIHYTPPLPEVA